MNVESGTDLVVSGRGIVSAAGSTLPELEERLSSGWVPSSARTLVSDGVDVPVPEYYPILNEGWFRPNGLRSSDFFTVASAAATESALNEAKIAGGEPRTSMVFATTFGPAQAGEAFAKRLATRGPRGLSPALFLDSIMSMPAGFLSIRYAIRGAIAVVNGVHPLEVARLWLATGRESICILTATDIPSSRVLHTFESLREPDARGSLRPVLGQASAAIVVESRESAERRGAPKFARIKAIASDLGSDEPADDLALSREKATHVMRSALDSAGLSPEQVHLVYSCANGLSWFDSEECIAIHRAVSDQIGICRPKESLGECGAASALASLLVATLPPGDEYGVDRLVTRNVLVNSFEAGGQFAATVIEVDEQTK